MAGGADWIESGESLARSSPAGTDFNLGTLDLTVKTISATDGVLGGFSIAAFFDGLTPLSSWVYTNNTGAPVIVKAIMVILVSQQDVGSVTIDFHKVVAGSGGPSGGFALVSATKELRLTGGLALNTPFAMLMDVLSNRTMAPLDKISMVFNNTPTSTVGAVTILF